MADRWFEIAAVDHFWICRRFEVFRRIAGGLIADSRAMAEFGCGHGLLQLQIEKAYGREVMGFDLNEIALKQNVSQRSTISCYDIYQKDSTLRERFDLIFLFDVLEHIANEDGFLNALLYHLAPSGRLVVNVPAGMWAYSAYDVAAGHVRRYSVRSLRDVAKRNGLHVNNYTFWGLPLMPALLLRKLWLLGNRNADDVISAGFDSRTRSLNQFLGIMSRCEPIPQTFLGTSLMAVFESGQQACLS
jgi:SAM-dependent methyltransferase